MREELNVDVVVVVEAPNRRRQTHIIIIKCKNVLFENHQFSVLNMEN